MSTCKKYSKNPGRNTTIEKFLVDFADPLDQALGIDKSTWPCCIIHDIDNLQHRRTHQFHRFHVATCVCFCYDLNFSVPPGTLFFLGGKGSPQASSCRFHIFCCPRCEELLKTSCTLCCRSSSCPGGFMTWSTWCTTQNAQINIKNTCTVGICRQKWNQKSDGWHAKHCKTIQSNTGNTMQNYTNNTIQTVQTKPNGLSTNLE